MGFHPQENTIASRFLHPLFEVPKDLSDAFLRALRGEEDDPDQTDSDSEAGEAQANDLLAGSMEYINTQFSDMFKRLTTGHTVPFFSSRCSGHINMDTTMPALLGYMTAMLSDQNNVAFEASPFTTAIELRVGEQICEMLGYNTDSDKDEPIGWGRITADGAIPNIEALWVARNLKYYPVALRHAVEEGELSYIGESLKHGQSFKVSLCDGTEEEFINCTPWNLMNLAAEEVAELNKRLCDVYGVSQIAMEKALEISIDVDQVARGDTINFKSEAQWQMLPETVDKSPVAFMCPSSHNSWPQNANKYIAQGATVKFVEVGVDSQGRMDTKNLRTKLEHCLENSIPVSSVVLNIGAHGNVDPVAEILEIRNEFRQKGLSFLVHCDAAQGGYYACMVDRKAKTKTNMRNTFYRSESERMAQRSGLCPYPTGGLCYRDGWMRHMIDSTLPDVYQLNCKDSGIGNGWKANFATVSGAWMSHEANLPHGGQDGFQTYLEDRVYNDTKIYSSIAVLADEGPYSIIPLRQLPAEVSGVSVEWVDEQKQFINARILAVDKETLFSDKDAWDLFTELGSDLTMNAFACNFNYRDGNEWVPNSSVTEANIMTARVCNRVSALRNKHDSGGGTLSMSLSKFAQSDHGRFPDNYKQQFKLEGQEDLYYLDNVTMTGQLVDDNQLSRSIEAFKKIVTEEAEYAIARNTIYPDTHSFVMQGEGPVHFVYLPKFHMKNHRYQLIIAGDLPEDVLHMYKEDRARNPDAFYILSNDHFLTLDDIMKCQDFDAVIDKGFLHEPEGIYSSHWIEDARLTNVRVIYKQSLEAEDLKSEYSHQKDESPYPRRLPFFMYGTPTNINIDHIFTASPNIQLNSSIVQCDFDRPLTSEQLHNGMVTVFDNRNEAVMQPMIRTNSPRIVNPHNNWHSPGLHFTRGQKFSVKVYKDYDTSQDPAATPITSGMITLGPCFADSERLNNVPETPVVHMGTGSPRNPYREESAASKAFEAAKKAVESRRLEEHNFPQSLGSGFADAGRKIKKLW
ncbi:hypothetical protein Dda_6248 [Drechslerella dactyloides]|uniref:Uncharacterized protein n=1 Tax=Drechslerella dactyloides TaxID=74499 RepID=A0AAD6IVG4_DREDA|nr:hypothetical protein Dda_6248 [Drechslerella dactyloides]